ncbi:DUF3466 family protein [Vibrio fluminensis]|uniref:DUF3466 family protein n=1 Tax=Vibrio fluminensis TaxID=2783614 RepID=UPI0018878252|nr:DUF3466 family protein [Vibrio fluminensis]
MRSNVFKLSAVAATVCASFAVNAAVYKVELYGPVDSNSKTYGVAIQDSPVNCWADGADCQTTQTNDHRIAVEERRFAAGFDYRDEAPFFYEFGFEWLARGEDGFQDYCGRFLGYVDNLCDNWVDEQYNRGYANEVNGVTDNTTAFIETTQQNATDQNVIINSVSPLVGTHYGSGFTSRTVAFVDGSDLDITGFTQSKAWEKAGNLTVGSVSKAHSPTELISQAAIWDNNSLKLVATSGSADGDSMPQGSARAIKSDGTFAVGYNSTSNNLPVAAVFDLNNLNSIPTKFVSAYNDDNKYLNSVLTSVNSNNIAIGTVKYRESNDGAYSNSLFYVPNITAGSLSASSFSGNIFFKSANGKAGAINNRNEVVGQIDYERHSEKGGKPRAQRAFATVLGDRSQSDAPFKNGAYYLDDLTYGLAENNKYRIIDATDISDASVISGTAYYCASGYESNAINATCGQRETIVAVKLIPIAGTSASDIQSRPVESNKIERSGASLGWLALGLLTLLGFRRKQ